MASQIHKLARSYRRYVAENPETTSQAESVVRVISYVIPGSSPVLSELLYSSSNLLILLNDGILRQANNIKFKVPVPSKTICTWLTVIEYVEVFLEITGEHLGGDFWHWVVVTCVHITKAILRYILLSRYNSGILYYPAIAPLKRKKELKLDSEDITPVPSEENLQELERRHQDVDSRYAHNFTLQSSGRAVRSLSASPALTQRSWEVPQDPINRPTNYLRTPLDAKQMLGEYCYTFRPLLHLASMYKYGRCSWKPWIIASCMDMSSVFLLGDMDQFNPTEKREIRRRCTLLILYLLRSPFYDKYSKARLITLLTYITNNVPLLRLISGPLLEYLPYWQRIYFYSWMS